MTRPRVGSRVRHWYAGTGTVRKITGWSWKASAVVDWDRGMPGIAWVRDLEAA